MGRSGSRTLPDTSAPPRATPRPADSDELARLRNELAQERRECATLHGALAHAAARAAALRHDGYHRLRNTLHLVCSLFNLQRATVPEAAARAVLDKAVERIALIGTVYGQLVREPAPGADAVVRDGAVGSRGLLAALCDELASGPATAGRVAVTVEAVDAPLTIAQAIPVGLIVRELVVNSLHHGFPSRHGGTVAVRLARDDRRWRLDVADDGIGLADPPEPGFGLELVRLMAAQLDGTLVRAAGPGTRHVVRFADPPDTNPGDR